MGEAVILKVLLEEKIVKFMNPEFILQKKPGEHAQAVLRGILDPDNGPVTIVADMDIQIYREGVQKILFQGLVSRVDREDGASDAGPLEQLELKAMSYTGLFDGGERNRSFQGRAQTYEAAAETVIQPYPNSGMIMQPELTGRQLGTLAVQYQETDWQFLKRLASRLGCPIIASHLTKGPKLFFGPAWSSTRHVIAQDEAEQVGELSEGLQEEGAPFNGFYWITQKTGMEAMDIGEIIQYRGIDFYIKELEIHVKDYGIRHQYSFCPKEAFQVAQIHNPLLTGLSLFGTVSDASHDRAKIHLDIDAWPESDCWYAYSTFYSMFYCMPERGDRVCLYFPEDLEASAFVLNSVKAFPDNRRMSASSSPGEPDGVETPKLKGEAPKETGDGEKTVALSPYMGGITHQKDGEVADFGMELGDGTSLSKGDLAGGAGQGAGQAGPPGGAASFLPTNTGGFESLAGDGKVKALSTSDGKMVVLNDRTGSVSVFLNGKTYLVLDGEGVKIRSPQQVTIWSEGSININAKTSVSFNAGEQLSLQCGGSGVVLMPGSAIVNGTDIKLNE